MTDHDATPILRRLLAVSSACREAFLEAAFLVRSPRLAALFIRRAEHQERIRAFLTPRLDSGSARVKYPEPPPGRGDTYALRAGLPPQSDDPYALLGACLRVLDSSILEFARVYAPAMPLAHRIALDRHHDQMRWSRDELVELLMAYKPALQFLGSQALEPRRAKVDPPQERQERWFGRRPDDRRPDDAGMLALTPLGGPVVVPQHGTGGTS